MFDVAQPLVHALEASRFALGTAASVTARSQTPYGGSRPDAAMAGVARSAIFNEAVMNAIHSRLAEIKAVTRV